MLSSLGFVRQSQLSISGITAEQLEALDGLIAKPEPPIEFSPVDQLCKDLKEAQFDTTQPSRYEAVLAQAFERLGFEAEHLGEPGKPDVLIVGRLGSDTYAAIVEAKTCREGSVVGLAQVNYNSINDHREEHTADYALLIAPAFAGGKLVEHAIKNNVGMITTEALVSIIRLHDQFPFSLLELQQLFGAKGLVEGIEREMSRLHSQHIDYLQLASSVLQIFDELERQQEVSEPISGKAVYFLLLGRTKPDEMAPPDRKQIDQVLALLSNPVLDILTPQEDGYVLTMSLGAAQCRLEALSSFLSVEA